VIRDALREWKGRRQTRKEAIAEIRRLVQAGLDSAGWRPLDTEEIKREGRRRLQQMKSTKGQRD